MTRLIGCVLLALVTCACGGDEGGLERASLGIEASDKDDRQAVVACEELPLLQGSRRFTRHIIDDRLTIVVNAVPSQISLDFDAEGAALGKSRTVPRGALLHGYSEDVDVLLLDGRLYKLTLTSGCLP